MSSRTRPEDQGNQSLERRRTYCVVLLGDDAHDHHMTRKLISTIGGRIAGPGNLLNHDGHGGEFSLRALCAQLGANREETCSDGWLTTESAVVTTDAD
jgi:hypothetical protein